MLYQLQHVLDEKLKHNLDNAKSIGVDIGSRGSKAVLLYEGKLYTNMVPSGISSKDTASELVVSLLKEADIQLKDIRGIVGTGYGSVAMEFPGTHFRPLTEITCHAMGAHYLHSATQTVIDIGGQDSKAIKINPYDGRVVDFIMNDKCAAGTGRFLEKVAQILELEIDQLGELVLRSEHPSDISSQCVVFAESEVISLRATGEPKEDIAYGIHLATARRIMGLLRKTGIMKDILFTGGVSNNVGMRRTLQEVIGEQIADTKLNPVFAGALGAAVYADELKREQG